MKRLRFPGSPARTPIWRWLAWWITEGANVAKTTRYAAVANGCMDLWFAMSSNYNCRLRPAEVLITQTGEARLIHRRQRLANLLMGFNLFQPCRWV